MNKSESHVSQKDEDEPFFFSLIQMVVIAIESTHQLQEYQHIQEYATLVGSRMMRKKIVECILAEAKNDIMLWSSPSRANLLIFNSAANENLCVQNLHDQNEVHVRSVAKSIAIDIKVIHFCKNLCQAKADLISFKQDINLYFQNS